MAASKGEPKQYDPSKVYLYVLGQEINDFGEDTFIKIARMEDMRSPTVGADGNVTINRSRNDVGLAEITIMHNSDSQQLLNSLAASDSPFPVMVHDKNSSGDVGAFSIYGYIQNTPDFVRGKAVGENTWTIILAAVSTVFSALENLADNLTEQ